jgi:PIN domain nuclease of toxin-antitoxin system
MTIYVDTHVLVWLAQGEPDKLGAAARSAIDKYDLLASPAAVLELELLHEIGRLRPAASKLIASLANDVGLQVCGMSFRTIVEHALKEKWGRDPFDRLIVANAKAAEAPLITRDQKILKNYSRAVW